MVVSLQLTIDADRCGKRKERGILGILKLLFPGRRIEVSISSSGRGRHFVVHNASDNWDEISRYRRMLGDDRLRLEIDKIRKTCRANTQVLYTQKRRRMARAIHSERAPSRPWKW